MLSVLVLVLVLVNVSYVLEHFQTVKDICSIGSAYRLEYLDSNIMSGSKPQLRKVKLNLNVYYSIVYSKLKIPIV